MDFLQRFKGKTSIMDKQGIDGIVKSKALPIEIHNIYNNSNQNNYEEPNASYLMRSSAPIMQSITQDNVTIGSKQKNTKIFTNITRDNNNNINNNSSQVFPRIGQQYNQPSSSSSTASSISQFTRGRHSESTNFQQQHQIALNASLIDLNNHKKQSINAINSLDDYNNNNYHQSLIRSSTLITDRGVNYNINHNDNINENSKYNNNNKSITQRISNNHLSQTLQVGQRQSQQQHHQHINPNYNSKNNTNITSIGVPHRQQSQQEYYSYNHSNPNFHSYSSVSLTGSYKLPPGMNNIVVPSDYELIAVPKALSQTQALPVNYLSDQNGFNQSHEYLHSSGLMLTKTSLQKDYSPMIQKSEQINKSVLKSSNSNTNKDYNSPQSKGSDSSINNQQKNITFTQAAQKQQQQSLLNSAAKNILEWNSNGKGKVQGNVGTSGGQFKYELDLMEEKHRDIIKNLDKIREKRTKK